jgi:glycosyltransferase involved in cell wall biosynthesis
VSLSALIVVNDEALALDACLTSLRGLVDEIVVVDTGSSDRSVAVAERHGAVVTAESWKDDPAAPRNRSLSLATGDWILAIDAAERVHGEFAAARAALDDAGEAAAFRVRTVPQVGWTPMLEPRLWRDRPDIRFDGHLHESVAAAIDRVAERDHLRIDLLEHLSIQCQGDPSDRVDRRARDEPVMLAELNRHADRAYVYDHLARMYAASGDSERAMDTWKRGIGATRPHEPARPDDRLLYVNLIHHLLAHGVLDDELESLVDEARGRFDRTPTLELAAARLAFATGRPRDALEPLDWLVGLDEAAIMATGASCDERVFGEWAWGLLGLCHFALGDDSAASDAFRRAEVLAPTDASYGARRRLAEARAATPTGI